MRSTALKRDGDNLLVINVTIDPGSIRLVPTIFGDVIDLEDFANSGELGGPGLPSRVLRAALPANSTPGEVRWEVAETHMLSREPVLVAPLQRPQPGTKEEDDPRQRPPHEADQQLRRSSAVIQEPLVEPLPRPEFVPPNAKLYAHNLEDPRRPARLIATEQIGLTPIAVIEINPVAYNGDGTLHLITEMEVILEYSSETKPSEPTDRITSRAQAARLVEMAQTMVINPELVWDITPLYPELITNVDYLIITDDSHWDATDISPTTTAGGLTAEFERLADWKRRRGLRSRVVALTDIVAGRYGNFMSGARDLQEVVRGFLRWSHQHWGVAWVLLGGDIGIIPMRRVPGASEGHIAVETTNPPDKNRSFWTGSHLRMHVDRPGTWFPGSVSGLTLVRSDTGLTIPYDTTGNQTLGWHFTTDDSFVTKTSTPTKFVRVNGSAAQINGKLQWIYNWNHIPTDLYYASLIGPHYGGSGHDWDLTGNGLYGQHTNNTDLDGVAYRADVSLGRAPVSSASQAAGFVDKVIAYERFRRPDGTSLSMSWPRKLLMLSANWGGRRGISASTTSPPGDWKYYHGAGDDHSLIHLAKPYENMEWRLLAEVTTTDIRLLPYNRTAGSGSRGWRYTKSATDLSASETTISIFGLTFHIPIPSNWAIVYGQAAELTPQKFIFDHTNADGSLRDQELLREQITTDLPAINDVSRLYEDDIDLTPAQAAAAPIEHLTPARVQTALDDGPHLVSLSGHGSSNGCCGLSVATAGGLTNGYHSFIAYADSCLTNQFDAEDAVSEHLLYNSNGGAVAYVGNTRFSWIGVGDNFQRRFFDRLQTTRHLGLLNDTRCSMVNESTGFYRLYNKWNIFSMNLMGDPEMPVWSRPPQTMTVDMPQHLDRRVPLQVYVRRQLLGIPVPLSGATVTIEQGSFRRTATTNASGRAVLDIAGTSLGDLDITVAKIGYLPFFDTVDVVGPAWVSGTVRVVAHQSPDRHRTLIELDLDTPIDGQSQREWVAWNGRADYRIILDAVTDAYISGEKINLYLASINSYGLIERFRFGAFPVLAVADIRREAILNTDLHVLTESREFALSGDGALAAAEAPASEVIDLTTEEEAEAPTPAPSP